MTDKIVIYFIHHCNSECIHFYHRYDDNDIAWCNLLQRRIAGREGHFATYMGGKDRIKRPIPDDCPLEDVKKK